MHPAQASNNASAGSDRVRLRRPTTPLTRRGRPIGLGVNLDGTTAEPATEDRRRPHLRTLPSETDLLCLPNRFAVGSCPPTPEGSQPAFARGDVSTPIRPVTGRPSLPPSSFTRRPIGSSCESLSSARRATGLPRFVDVPGWGGSQLFVGGASSAPGELGAPGPDHMPFWPERDSILRSFLVTTFIAALRELTRPPDPGPRPR